ncbi:autotransporter outer membrane beta-barrel domain-containing protein [Oxalobacter paraformigenes]|uniref:Outer membrane autotransporter barrel domain-containing protein n=1 Tax=Oxalobacter paraformigenes TaxID=556268 RepID=C3X3S6_9BURK|nr:autotransporter outer membrane beta-barrel domain-containing protein [Oxalobacter paraformigenes]EEO27862.1 outer membrane autotransporter barrel domain-containing protein [Oxalobacter paraformigenes]
MAAERVFGQAKRLSGKSGGRVSGVFPERTRLSVAIALVVTPFFVVQQACAEWIDRYENVRPSGGSAPAYNIRDRWIDVSSGSSLMGFNEDGTELSSEAWPNIASGEGGVTSYRARFYTSWGIDDLDTPLSAVKGTGSTVYWDFLAPESSRIVATLDVGGSRSHWHSGLYGIYARKYTHKYDDGNGAAHFNFLSKETAILASNHNGLSGNVAAIRLEEGGSVSFWGQDELRADPALGMADTGLGVRKVSIAASNEYGGASGNVYGILNTRGDIHLGADTTRIEVFNKGVNRDGVAIGKDTVDIASHAIGIFNSGGVLENRSDLVIATGNAAVRQENGTGDGETVSTGEGVTVGLFNARYADQSEKPGFGSRGSRVDSTGSVTMDLQAKNEVFGLMQTHEETFSSFAGETRISASSTDAGAYGVFATEKTQAGFTGQLAYAVRSGAADAYGVLADKGARVTVNGGLKASVDRTQYDESLKKARAIEAWGGAQVMVNTEGRHLVEVDGDLHTAPEGTGGSGGSGNPGDLSAALSMNVDVLAWAIRDNGGIILRSAALAGRDEVPAGWRESARAADDASGLAGEREKITFVMDAAGSYLTGAANGNIDMTVSEATRWDVTADSRYAILRANGGTIDFYHPEKRYDDALPFQKMTVGDMVAPVARAGGTGSTFVMNTDMLSAGKTVMSYDGMTYFGGDLVSQGAIDPATGKFTANPVYRYRGQDVEVALSGMTVGEVKGTLEYERRYGDFLSVRSASGGAQTYAVRIHDPAVKNDRAYDDTVLKFATVPQNVTLVGQAVQHSPLFVYTPRIWRTEHHASGQSVYDEAGGRFVVKDDTRFTKAEYENLGLSETAADENGYVDYWLSGFRREVSEEGRTPVKAAAASFAGWRWWNENDTLLKRMGELRYSDGQDGAWARVIRSKHEDGGTYGFTGYTTILQIGADRREIGEKGMWRRGAALSWGETDTRFSQGKGENTNTSLTLYATWLGYKGHYLDLVVKGSRLRTDYETFGAFADHGVGRNWAASASAEYGRKKKVHADNWFVEPQLQVTYGHLWGGDYTTRQGIHVDQKDADSLVGRAGVVLSREFESEYRRPKRAYVKASALHEFMGRDRFMLRDAAGGSAGLANDMGGTWYEAGFGMNMVLKEGMHVYFDFERSFGGQVDMPWRVEGGVRVEF